QIENWFVSIAGKTRTNVKIIDPAQNQVTDINFPGQAPIAADIAALHHAIDRLSNECDWFVISGSIPAGVSASLYAELVARLKAQGKTVVLDASGDSLRQAIPFAPDAIKPNIAELQELVGQTFASETAIAMAAQRLVSQGIRSVVVSMGAKGAIFAEAEETIVARPPRVQVVSTVGAGDAMVSGLIVGKRRGLPLADCARLATAFSIGALGQLGPRLPPPNAIESLMHQVEVQPLVATEIAT
ncbi:MAG: hexose kinase, partial [Microcoleus sp. SIO2G3]|nr:hexose kinase [Microcoleus sp. SIO2G3]